MADLRPSACRFRLQDEGKAYPRSSCSACGRGIMTGLGRRCHLEIEARDAQAARIAEIEGERDRQYDQNVEQIVYIAKLEAEVARLRPPMVAVMAALAAAISLLERSPKGAAPSDKMFDLMLSDYQRALGNARAALAAPDTGGAADGE